MNLFCPCWPERQYPFVYFHSSLFVEGHNHSLSCQFILAVLFIVLYDILTQTVDGGIVTQDALDATIVPTGFVYLFHRSTLIGQFVKLIIQLSEGVFVEFQVNDSALIVHRSCSTICYSLSHIVHIDIIAKDLYCALIPTVNRCTRKPDEDRIG